jgi:hypothetical protein
MNTHRSEKIGKGLVIALALFNIVFHLVFYNNLEYHRDELLYFSLGLHPAFGYATVPPLIGWIAAVMQFIFGYSLFAVKLFPAVLSGVLVILSSKICKELGGKIYAQILCALAIVFMPVGIRAFHLFQPVPVDLVLWSLVLYYTLRYVNTEKNKYLLILGALLGVALLNKYLILLLIIALLISLVFSVHRKVFSVKSLYLSAGITMLILLPNLIWQLMHDLPVIGHMQALNDNQLVHVDRMNFLMDQLLMSFSVCLLLLAGFFFLLRNAKYRYLAISSLIVFTILIILKGKSYYTIGVFPVLIAAGCVAAERFSTNIFYRVLIPLLIIAITLPALPIGIPVYKEDGLVRYFQKLEKNYGLEIGRRFEDGTIHSLPQDYADQLGWEELTAITLKAYNRVEDKKKLVIYCENYGQAGAIAVIGKKYNLPEPVSFHESFLYWAPAQFEQDPEYFIYINDELGDDVENLFEEIMVVGQISNRNAREYGTTVYLCSRPRSSFNAFWKDVLSRVEDPF